MSVNVPPKLGNSSVPYIHSKTRACAPTGAVNSKVSNVVSLVVKPRISPAPPPAVVERPLEELNNGGVASPLESAMPPSKSNVSAPTVPKLTPENLTAEA